MKHIDPHCHCRDGQEVYKTTIRKVSRLAASQEIVAVFDMPNTNPPILTEKDVVARLKLAKKRKPLVKYFLYVGLTSIKEQVEEAVRLVEKYPEVVGLKLYTSETTGGLGTVSEKGQKDIYLFLTALNYQGVLAVHCEKASWFRFWLFDPKDPWTYGLAWPAEAEIASVNDQIKFDKEAQFKGHLHICHISCPESVDLVWQAKRDIQITSGATLHHLFFSEAEMRKKTGLLYKVNPPLRDIKRVKMLLERLRQRKIDWIETDHAPHSRREKLNYPYLSGISSTLPFYRKYLFRLTLHGLTWLDIQDLTYWNIKKVFGEKLKGV